jgi:GntR family transcriptional regulator/MocR family aminotransferase
MLPQTVGDLLSSPIDRRAATPLFRQVYVGLTTAILEQRLLPGAKLAASRTLAGRLGLSRTAIVFAYEQLLAEGYASEAANFLSEGAWVANDAHFTGLSAHKTTTIRRTIRL